MKWKAAMAYSLLSYFILLLVIIFADIVWDIPFIFEEIATVTGGFISIVPLLTILGFVVFRYRFEELENEMSYNMEKFNESNDMILSLDNKPINKQTSSIEDGSEISSSPNVIGHGESTPLPQSTKNLSMDITDEVMNTRVLQQVKQIPSIDGQESETIQSPDVIGHVEAPPLPKPTEHLSMDITDEVMNTRVLQQVKQIPSIDGQESETIQSPDVIGRKKATSLPKLTGNFSMGIADEVINIRALRQGKQIILCKTHKKTNNFIFLFPKYTFESDFTPSEKGLKLMDHPINSQSTKYIAKIEYISIPGKNRKFWEELSDEGEFNLWHIDKGPLKYFKKIGGKKMLLWIFRVYELPFEIKVNDDYKVPHASISRMTNPDTLKRIQSGFDNGEFKPVLSDDEYERRKTKIKAIVDKWQ